MRRPGVNPGQNKATCGRVARPISIPHPGASLLRSPPAAMSLSVILFAVVAAASHAGASNCHRHTPTNSTQLIGRKYCRHVIITWSIRSRGIDHRTHIITTTSP